MSDCHLYVVFCSVRNNILGMGCGSSTNASDPVGKPGKGKFSRCKLVENLYILSVIYQHGVIIMWQRITLNVYQHGVIIMWQRITLNDE